MSNVPAVREPAVPALASTPALAGISARSIALQKLYRGEFQADLVQEGVVPAGSIYMATGPDDPEPQVLVKDGTAEKEKGVLAHVLKVTEGKSGRIDGDFRSFAAGDPDAPSAQDNGRPLDPTLTFWLALPEVDPDMPVKVTMSRTSYKTAQRIVTRLLRHRGTAHDLAFRLKLQKRESESGGSKYRWFVWREQLVDAKPEHVEVAGNLAGIVFSQPEADIERTSTNNQPRI